MISFRGTDSDRLRAQRECLRCGAPRTGKKRKGRESFVCHPCYLSMRAAPVTLVCSFCGKTFERQRYVAKKAQGLGCVDAYCGVECSRAHHAVKNSHGCETCGGPVVKKTRRFCETCRPRRSRKTLTPRVCPECESTFQPKTSRTVYCSRGCADRAHSDRMKGQGNSHYKDGTSYSKCFRLMRRFVIERDGACVVCGDARAKRMPVHHVNENPKDNRPENLVLLCGTCHAIHHKSTSTPWPWFGAYAIEASSSMTSRWREATTSLLRAYSSTTA